MPDAQQHIPLTRRFGAFWESFGPWLLGIAAGVVLWWWNPPTDRIAHAIARFVDGSIAAAAVLAGFQITALSLLLSISDRPIVIRLRNLGFYERLIKFQWQAISAMFIWLLASLALLIVLGGTADAEGRVADLGQFTRWSAIFLLAVMVAAVCAGFRVSRLLIKVLRKGH